MAVTLTITGRNRRDPLYQHIANGRRTRRAPQVGRRPTCKCVSLVIPWHAGIEISATRSASRTLLFLLESCVVVSPGATALPATATASWEAMPR